jgi:hypothetical protein
MVRKTQTKRTKRTKKHMKGTGKKDKDKKSNTPVLNSLFSNNFGIKHNPLFKNNNNNLPPGFSRNNQLVYNNSNSGYVSLGSTNGVPSNPYTPMEPLYTNLSRNPTVGESKLRKSIINGNLLKNTAKA